MSDASTRELAQLYDSLARFQWLGRRLRGASAGEALEMHKRLSPRPPGDAEEGPAAGTAGLHGWLWEGLAPTPGVRVLDVGAGFGATLFDWAARDPRGSFTGLSLSGYQVRVAAAEARRLGLSNRCRFHQQSYTDPIEGTFDLVVSVESLFHAPRLAATLTHLAERLAAGGQLVLVEDMAREAATRADPDARELLARWSTERLHTRADFEAALAAAGLVSERAVDLTARVPRQDAGELARAERRLTRLRRLLPRRSWRRLVDAFLGGFALERLYARGLMAYRAHFTRRAGVPA